MAKPIYDWIGGERVELKQWLDGVTIPDDDGVMMVVSSLTNDPSYANYINARLLYALLHVYFNDDPLEDHEVRSATEVLTRLKTDS